MHASADAALFTDPELDDIAGGRHGNLFSALGAQPMDGGWRLAAFVPGARSVRAVGLDGTEIAALAPQGRDVFAALLAERPEAWRFEAGRGGDAWVEEDPYRFGPILGAQDEHYISEGTHGRLWDVLGAHPCEHEGAPGVRFAVWAPGARRTHRLPAVRLRSPWLGWARRQRGAVRPRLSRQTSPARSACRHRSSQQGCGHCLWPIVQKS